MDTKTAWDACGDWWWTANYELRIKGGRTIYAEATATRDYQRVVLTRLKALPDGRIRTVRRYVDHDTPIELVPLPKR